MFPQLMTIGKIVLSWEYPPANYEIMVNSGETWENFMEITNPQMKLVIDFQPRMSIGVMLKLKAFDPSNPLPTGKLAYGL